MEFTQTYAQPSEARMSNDGLHLDVSSELSRPRVALEGMVHDSLAYARLMLALHAVVSGDHRAKQKDHTAYQAWVQERYLEELGPELARRAARMPGLIERRTALTTDVKNLRTQIQPLEQTLMSADFLSARAKYFKYLYTHDLDAWYVLDPVVSVHPDCVIFEVFSIDESSYGRVTVPMDKLQTSGETVYGTTNIDFSQRLADEISRVRSYRPAWIQIGAEGVTLSTGAGAQVEKKIDLPPSWVRGFLQVQSAASFPGIDVRLSAATVADLLDALRRRRETTGPRSLRFQLTPGEKPVIVIEPWNIEVREATYRYEGPSAETVRVWGRRRLFALESLLPHADFVQARLLGTGMPSYWTVFQASHRFDLGLSGWTKNDWSRSARFDLLASTGNVSNDDAVTVANALQTSLRATPEEMAAQTGLTRDAATSALQRLCREGRVMYDLAQGAYRWRQLLPFPAPAETDEDRRLIQARRLVANGAVKWLKPGEEDDESFGSGKPSEDVTRLHARISGETRGEKKFSVTLDIDNDGRVRFANCTCSWHRREKLRKGPCAHILAASALASQQVVAAKAAAGTGGTLRPDRFKDQTFVFTGALTLFTREQAEALVAQGGGKASGSVSKTTTYLVAGDKAGSKLTKAAELKVPVLTEAQFQAMLEDKTL